MRSYSQGLLLGLLVAGGAANLPAALAEEATTNVWLTLDRLFDSGEFEGQGSGFLQWSPSGHDYYTWETPKGGGGGRDLVRHDPETDRAEVVAPATAFNPPGRGGGVSVESFEFSPDASKLLVFSNSKRVWRQHNQGDYWLLDLGSRELRKLGGDAEPSTLRFAKFSPDGTRVAYVREHNLYVQDLRDFRITPLTTDGSATLINGTFDWVYEEELDLRDGFRWSPDGQAVAYWQLDTEGVREFLLINNTDGLYARTLPIPYPKAGERNAAGRIGVVSAAGGRTTWLQVPGDPREHYLARLQWVTNTTGLLVQQFNRVQNTNRVFLADPKTGQVRTVLVETDRAWVDNENEATVLRRGSRFLWLSERDGWRHAYSVSRSGQRMRCLTPGPFDVVSLEGCDEAGGWLYFAASPTNATQRYLFRARLRGGGVERLTPPDQPGTHSYRLSADARWALHTYSTFSRPPVTELIRLPAHKSVKVLADNQKLREKLATLKQPAGEFFQVDIGQGVKLDGWCLRPPDFDPARKYPLFFHVYGEPAGQTVRDSWGGRSHLWHWMLAQQGYLVVSVDNRGTPAPRGRAWRKIVHRQIGILAPADQAAAVRALLSRWPYADPARVGIWGWSGGGSMSLHAILQYPDLYQTALAVAPVPNQRLYDTIYQERYMGLPADNPEGYRKGSPLTYASQLKGRLLIVHGTGDDNCHYQGTEALINELIACNKPFTMMAYPNRSHGIGEGRNTTRHLYHLLTRYLTENLPPISPSGERPAASGAQ